MLLSSKLRTGVFASGVGRPALVHQALFHDDGISLAILKNRLKRVKSRRPWKIRHLDSATERYWRIKYKVVWSRGHVYLKKRGFFSPGRALVIPVLLDNLNQRNTRAKKGKPPVHFQLTFTSLLPNFFRELHVIVACSRLYLLTMGPTSPKLEDTCGKKKRGKFDRCHQ